MPFCKNITHEFSTKWSLYSGLKAHHFRRDINEDQKALYRDLWGRRRFLKLQASLEPSSLQLGNEDNCRSCFELDPQDTGRFAIQSDHSMWYKKIFAAGIVAQPCECCKICLTCSGFAGSWLAWGLRAGLACNLLVCHLLLARAQLDGRTGSVSFWPSTSSRSHGVLNLMMYCTLSAWSDTFGEWFYSWRWCPRLDWIQSERLLTPEPVSGFMRLWCPHGGWAGWLFTSSSDLTRRLVFDLDWPLVLFGLCTSDVFQRTNIADKRGMSGRFMSTIYGNWYIFLAAAILATLIGCAAKRLKDNNLTIFVRTHTGRLAWRDWTLSKPSFWMPDPLTLWRYLYIVGLFLDAKTVVNATFNLITFLPLGLVLRWSHQTGSNPNQELTSLFLVLRHWHLLAAGRSTTRPCSYISDDMQAPGNWIFGTEWGKDFSHPRWYPAGHFSNHQVWFADCRIDPTLYMTYSICVFNASCSKPWHLILPCRSL